MSTFTIRMPSGSCLTFTGREAWTLRRLLEAGSAGVTTIDHPAPRWSHYIFKLRKAGLVISTEYERHTGPFPALMAAIGSKPRVTVVNKVEVAA